MAASRERRTAIENSDVVEPEEAASKYVAPLWILAVHPPVEVQHQALEGAFQETNIRAAQFCLDSVEKQRRPGVHRGIHVAKVPLVCRNLPVGMGVEVSEHKQELLFGEVEV